MNKIIIIGAGLAGVSLAYALRNTVPSITLLDNKPEFVIDEADLNARSIALSYGSYKILASSHFQIWDQLLPYTTPIHSIHISDRGHFGRTVIGREEIEVAALGFSIQAQMLYKVLYSQLALFPSIKIIRPVSDLKIDLERQVTYRAASLDSETHSEIADLIVLAEGGQSTLIDQLKFDRNKKDYGQTAIVGNITLSEPHHNRAFERFTAEGPIALLPIDTHKMALVWTTSPTQVETLLKKDKKDFLSDLQTAFGLRAGYFREVSELSAYPLKLDYVEEPLQNNILLLGNSAHTIHPVAAQGFNLSLSDIEVLAHMLKDVAKEMVGWIREPSGEHNPPKNNDKNFDLVDYASLREANPPYVIQDDLLQKCLKNYVESRRSKQKKIMRFTDSLIRVFSTDHFPLAPLRGWGLSVLNNIPFIKRHVIKSVMGYYEDRAAPL